MFILRRLLTPVFILRRSPSSFVDPRSHVTSGAPKILTSSSCQLKKGGAVTHVQPQISSAPCTFCRTRSVCHVADRYPPLSVAKTTCRSQSMLTFRINSSDATSHPDLRFSHIMLVMVQACSRAVQVARPSPVSIETPPVVRLFIGTQKQISGPPLCPY